MTVEHAQLPRLNRQDAVATKQTAVGRDTQHSRFGIKTKLFLAFFSFAGLTVLASAIAWYVFRDIERAVTRVTVESVPSIITALSSAEKSAEIAAAAPTLMAVGNQEERVLEEAKLEERTRVSYSDKGSDCLEGAAGKNFRSFENRAGNYGEDP